MGNKSSKIQDRLDECDNIRKKYNHIDDLLVDLKGYKCDKKLGSGSFGETYLFKKGKSKIAVKALKENNKDVMNEVDILEKIKKNCKRALCHKKVFSYPGATYIVTQFIEGVSLWDYYFNIKHPTEQDIKSTYSLIKQLLKAIEDIHELKVVHFDIKPENIMINNNSLHLIDFGGAKYSSNGRYNQSTYTSGYVPSEPEGTMSFNEAKFRDYYAFFKTFRNDTIGYLSPFDDILDSRFVSEKDRILFKLFDTEGITSRNYKKRIFLIKKLLSQ